MTKISVYNIDEYVTADDKWIGTDVNTYNKTKNFTPRKLSHYFNNNQVINTGVDLLYKYFTITPPETRPTGTLSFETEIGPTVNFSAISTFLLSNTTLKGNYIVEFFDFLVGTNVLLYKAKNINLFGSYKILSVEEYLPEPNFFVVNVEFIEGNGFIEEDEDYMISLIDISSGGGGSQDLQSVTDEGATTTNGITITVGDGGGNGITSFSSQGYGVRGESNEYIGVYGTSTSAAGVYGFSGSEGVIGEGATGIKGIGYYGVDGNSYDGVGVIAQTNIGIGVSAVSESDGTGIYAYSSSGKGIEVYGNGTISVDVNLGSTNKGVVIDSGTSSTGNPIEVNKNGVNKLVVNQQGELTATKLIKQGGSPSEILAADGSVITAGTNITISAGTISATGGGGSQDLQSVTDEGANTDNPITILANTSGDSLQVTNTGTGSAIKATSNSTDDGGFNAITAYAYNAGGAAGYFFADACNALFAQTTTPVYAAIDITAQGTSINCYSIADTVAVLNQTLNNKGLVINSGASSTGNFIELDKNGVNKLTVNQAGELTAQKLIKEGGFDFQFLKADGSVDNNTYLTSADLPSTLDLYATTTASDISGYTVLVRNISDTRYNTIAQNVSTGVITSIAQLVGSLVTDANIISGNPGVFDFKTIGNISRTSGTGQAEFFFRIYKRNLAGTETLIAQSDYTLPVTNGGYVEFSATALWNDGVFLDTDRVVLKYYANRLTSPVGSDPTYQFQFGGTSPVRSSAAIPTSVMPNIYLRDLADVENVDALNNEVLYWNDPASLWEHSLAENLVPLATATQKGLVSTGDQTFAGSKTFTDTINATSENDYAISVISVNSDGLSAESTNGNGVVGVSVNGIGGVFLTTNNANIAQFQTGFDIKATVKADGTFAGTGLNASGQTINTIASFDASKNVVSLSTATYPSLTELALVKGVSGSSVQTQLDGKQATLSSTVNIKSINGNDILGSGNLTITAAPEELAAFRMLANNSAVTAVPTVQVFKDIGEQDYILSPTFTPITGPTNIISNTYKYEQVGSLVTVRVNLIYTTPASITQVVIPLPADMPTPLAPTGLGAALDVLYYGVGMFIGTTTTVSAATRSCLLRKNATTGFEFVITHTTAISSRVISLTLQYFAE